MHSKTDKIEIMINEADEVIKELFQSLKYRYKKKLESMKGSEFFWFLFWFLFVCFCFFYLGFLSRTFTHYRTAEERGGIPLTPHYYLQLLDRQLNISRATTAESSTLHTASSWTRARNLWIPSASH